MGSRRSCAGNLLLIALLVLGVGQSSARLEWVKQPENTAVRLGEDLTIPCAARWLEEGERDAVEDISGHKLSLTSSEAKGNTAHPLVFAPSRSSTRPPVSPPTLTYTWALNHMPLSDKGSKLPNHSLFVPNAGSFDLGNYTCSVRAEFKAAGGSHHSDELLVGSALVIAAYLHPFVIHPESLAVSVGEMAVLTCVTGVGAPSVEITWLREGHPFTGGTQQTATFGDYDPSGLTSQLSARLAVEMSADLFGRFQCRAGNPVLGGFELSKFAEISNKVKPSNDLPVILWDNPSSMVVGEGQDLVLSCKSTESTEPAKVSWYLGRYRVDESRRVYALLDSDNSLGFFPVRLQDAGQYSCRASNSKGIVESPPLDLVVAYLNVEFAVHPSNTFAIYGTTAVLRCEPPESIPAAQVLWYKDYLSLDLNDVTHGGRLALTGQGDLQLTSVLMSDSGLYYCEAYNNYTSPSSRTSRVARLTVKGPPIISSPPTATQVVKGRLLQLRCLVNSDPAPVISWLFEGRPISASSTVAFVNRSQTLVVSNVGKPWEGWYTCRARNSYGNISAEAFVTVIVPPESLQPIGQLVVASGSSVRIPCPVLSEPMPEILWFYNETQVYPESGEAPSRLQWQLRFPDLLLKSVVSENAGNYTCVGVNEGGTASSTGFLTVNVPPSVSVSPRHTVALIGQPVTLTCAVAGQPSPVSHWLYNASTELPGDIELSNNNQTLTLPALTWTNVGLYTCLGSNLVGHSQAQAEVQAMVSPQVTELDTPTGPVKENTAVTLRCRAQGVPIPSVKWTHQGQPIVPSLNGRVRLPGRGVLVLEAALREDSGHYECVASSEAGVDQAGYSLTILGPPEPPVLLSAAPILPGSVYLLWKWPALASDLGHEIDGFKIWYREKASKTFQEFPVSLPGNATRLEVTGLRPHREYVFYVTVYGATGASDPSNLLSAITLQAEPSTPQNLRTIEVAGTSATLIWEVPVEPNGLVRQYQLQYKRLGDLYDEWTVVNISAPHFPTHETALAELRPYTRYTAAVRAANVQSDLMLWGDFCPPLVFWTLMSAPALPPQFVEVSPTSPYTLQVAWQPIPTLAQNGPILSYDVTYTNTRAEDSNTVRVSNSSGKLEITGLSPWRQYSVTVRGENPRGLSPLSSAVIGRTLPIAPIVPPGNLRVQPSSDSSLTLHWETLPESLVTCNVTSYTVEFRQHGASLWASKTAPSSESHPTLIIDRLEAWTWYEARVAAVTSDLSPGLGPFTEPALVRTLQGASGLVTAVSFNPSEDSIELSWQPPKIVRGILIGYKVSYKRLSGTGSDTSSRDVLVYSTMTLTLTDLDPASLYNISIAAVNGAGPGHETVLRVQTLPQPVPPSTEYAIYNASSAEPYSSNGSEINLSQKSSSSHIRKNLAAIVAGSIVGAIALTSCTVFICMQCIKYRRKQRLNYVVSEDCVIIETDSSYYRPNESSPPADDLISPPKPSLSFYTSPRATSSSVSSSSTSSSIANQQRQQQQQYSVPSHHYGQPPYSSTALNDPENQTPNLSSSICNNNPNAISSTSGPSENTPSDMMDSSMPTSGKKSDLSKKRSFSGGVSLSKRLSRKYSKLDEDRERSTEDASGIENLGYCVAGPDQALDVDDVVLRVEGLMGSRVGDMSFDTESITSEVTRRRNRMRTESAAAIAILRSTADVGSLVLATENGRGMLGSVGSVGLSLGAEPEEEIEDFGSEVIFNERTVL